MKPIIDYIKGKTNDCNNKVVTIFLFVLSFILIFGGIEKISAAYGNTPYRYPILPACTRFEYDIFKSIDFDDEEEDEADEDYDYTDKDDIKKMSDVDKWIRLYHKTVGEVIDEQFEDTSPECVGATYAQALSPKAKLWNLAGRLPSWNDYTWQYPLPDTDGDGLPGPPDDTANPPVPNPAGPLNNNLYRLSQLDMGTVLLEYLQMYECALVERSIFLPTETLDQEQRRSRRLGELPSPIKDLIFISEVVNNAIADRKLIFDELLFARRSLKRTLALTTGYLRMKPMETEILCLQQASLDLRNSFALAADASSCLPRVWNIKTSLRNYKEED